MDDDEAKWEEEMTLTAKLEAFMEENEDEHGTEANIKPERRLHRRSDINAFILLDKLVAADVEHRSMVRDARHDQIFLDVEPHELMKVASEEDLLDLMRCGVFFDSGHVSLSMFV